MFMFHLQERKKGVKAQHAPFLYKSITYIILTMSVEINPVATPKGKEGGEMSVR